MGSYDHWKLASPEDAQTPFDERMDDRDWVRCDLCEDWMEDGTGSRLGRAYLCPACFYSQPVVIEDLAAQLTAEEKVGK